MLTDVLRTKAWREANPERYKVAAHTRYLANRQKVLDRSRASKLRVRYGISVEDYDEMVRAQDGKCAICGKIPSKRLHVDHNHTTNARRKLLCATCNALLGHAQDSVTILKAAILYLEAHL